MADLHLRLFALFLRNHGWLRLDCRCQRQFLRFLKLCFDLFERRLLAFLALIFNSGLATRREGGRAFSLVALNLFELGLEPNDARTQGSDLLVVDHELFSLLILELGDDFFEESLLPLSVGVLLLNTLIE